MDDGSRVVRRRTSITKEWLSQEGIENIEAKENRGVVRGISQEMMGCGEKNS